jgi:hypothetical protein
MPTTETTILPDHILAAVLVLAKKKLAQPRLAFRGHDFQLQEIFHDLRSSNKFPILNAFVFSDSGPEPYSPALSESVSRLQLSGLIGRENPDYEIVFLQDSADRFFNDVLSGEFSGDQLEQISNIASQFLERVKTT